MVDLDSTATVVALVTFAAVILIILAVIRCCYKMQKNLERKLRRQTMADVNVAHEIDEQEQSSGEPVALELTSYGTQPLPQEIETDDALQLVVWTCQQYIISLL